MKIEFIVQAVATLLGGAFAVLGWETLGVFSLLGVAIPAGNLYALYERAAQEVSKARLEEIENHLKVLKKIKEMIPNV